MNENDIACVVIEAAIAVHLELGPGLLESVYETILAYELFRRGLNTRKQVPVAIEYRGLRFDEGFRADLLVNEKVLLEVKSLETVENVYRKQLLTYLKLTGLKLGYILNFGEEFMKDGFTRIVNNLDEYPPSCAPREKS